jgi:hypothetical protein
LIRGRLRAATEARICGRPPYGYISLLVGCGFTDIRESKKIHDWKLNLAKRD